MHETAIFSLLANMSFKVSKDHRCRYQSKARMRLPISDWHWHPISHRFEVIADYCSNFDHFTF